MKKVALAEDAFKPNPFLSKTRATGIDGEQEQGKYESCFPIRFRHSMPLSSRKLSEAITEQKIVEAY